VQSWWRFQTKAHLQQDQPCFQDGCADTVYHWKLSLTIRKKFYNEIVDTVPKLKKIKKANINPYHSQTTPL
jgi:hypothetical protein